MPRKKRNPNDSDRRYPSVLAYLKDKGLTQGELARDVGLSNAQMSRIVNRQTQPSLGLAVKLSVICRVPVEAFVVWD